MISFDYWARLARLQDLMADRGVDVALLSIGADLPYFTGYEAMDSERLTVLVVRPDSQPVLLIPKLEALRVRLDGLIVEPWSEADDPIEKATALVNTPAKVLVGDHMWSVFLLGFQRAWPHSSWVPASELTTELRMRKDSAELQALRQAAHAVDRAMARIPGEVRFSGRTERDVARDLAELTVAEGHDVAEFTIVASGPNGASPHHEPTNRINEKGDLVVCDYGGRWSGYYSDSTRTFVVGDPTPRQTEIHSVVLGANAAGRAAVSPRTPCEEIDRAARRVIVEAGFGEYFIHRTGHGIGLEVHEHPYMIEGNGRRLEEGMAFSVEPGIYLPGEFGVRIEDIVVCNEQGVEDLNRSDRSLVEVG